MMVSVDGYFEGVNHDLSWHTVDAEFNAFAEEQNIGSVDLLLFGHRTYDLMASWWPTEQGMADDPEIAQFMNTTAKIVVSHDAFQPAWENTRVMSENVFDEIEKLKTLSGKDIALFGSNNLCVSLMGAGLVDEFRIMVNPVALGVGTPLFAGLSKKMKFKLLKTREFKSGNILHYYVLT